MAVLRIVPDLKVSNPEDAKAFYGDIMGLDILMDQGWVATYGAPTQGPMQITFATQGGSDQPVPALSIEVDNLEETLARCTDAGLKPVYGPVDEPWGVRRFFVTDPFGNLVNILQHI